MDGEIVPVLERSEHLSGTRLAALKLQSAGAEAPEDGWNTKYECASLLTIECHQEDF